MMPTYPEGPGYKAHGTSLEAAKAVKARDEALRRQVLKVLACAQLTTDECAEVLNESVLSVRPRFSQLHMHGLIEPTGERRPSITGKPSNVWRLTGKLIQACFL